MNLNRVESTNIIHLRSLRAPGDLPSRSRIAPTVGDSLAAARLLRTEGVRLDVVPEHVSSGAEVLVDRVDAPENNIGSASVDVLGAPRILVIAAQPGEAHDVMASLRSTGIQADLQTPRQVVPTLSYLRKYASVVVVDTAADVLAPISWRNSSRMCATSATGSP